MIKALTKFSQKAKKGSYRAIFLALFCYLFYHLINSGLLLSKWPEKIKTLKILTEENTLYESKKNSLKSQIFGLSLESIDLDLLDQRARYILGHSDKNEIIIYESKE